MKYSPLVLVTGLSIILLGAGCGVVPRLTGASGVIQSQTPGAATGAGASVVGPANSASPTTQTSERRVAYYPPPSVVIPDVAAKVQVQTPTSVPQPQLPPVVIQPPATQPQYPAWTYEHVSTTIGEHQDAAGLVKAAKVASGWSTVRWLGILTTLVGIAGWLYSYNNHETGYPLVFIKVAIAGLIITIVGSNPWLLLLLIIPVGFYALQKLNLLRLPTL